MVRWVFEKLAAELRLVLPASYHVEVNGRGWEWRVERWTWVNEKSRGVTYQVGRTLLFVYGPVAA